MRTTHKLKLLLAAACLAQSAFASEVYLAAVPTAWRLQNYVPDTVLAFFTGAACTNGRLSFPASATAADKNRFVAMLMAAKATGKPIAVFYDDAGKPNECTIRSYALLEE